jgi:hypothetical protein
MLYNAESICKSLNVSIKRTLREYMKEKIKKFILRLWYYVPQTLPTTGKPEFERLMKQLSYVYGLPDEASYHHAIATIIMNQSPTTDKIPPRFFAKSIRKAMANEIAFARLQELREEEKRQRESASEGMVSQA